MGHRYAIRQSCLFVALGLGLWLLLTLGSPTPAHAGDEPDDGPLLPPAAESDVSIVPTDQAPDEQIEPRKSAESDDGPGLIDTADIAPAAAIGWALLALASITATGIGLTRLTRMLYAWRTPASLGASGFGPLTDPTATPTTFSLLVPVRRGDAQLGETLDRLAAIEHQAFEVVAIVGYDDLPGRGAAVAAAARHPDRVRTFVDRQRRRSRAGRLNAVLDDVRGHVIGVFDVGDQAHPYLLRHVHASLADPTVGAVQGGVRHVVTKPRWFTPCSVVDQYFWSRSRLHFHARQRFTPLDRSSVFVRAALLREAGGWDARCVSEGSELGVRLSVQGTPIVVAYDPELATRTPAPTTLKSLIGAHAQRIRGFVQVLRKGVWRDLPTRRQRLLARSTLARPLVEAVTSLAVAGGIVAALIFGAPPLALVLAFLPTLPALIGVGVALAGLSELGRLEGRPVRILDRLRLVVAFVPHDLLVSVAALSAVAGELTGRSRWDGPGVPVAPAKDKKDKAPHVLDLGPDDDAPAPPVDITRDGWGEPVSAGRELPA
jgi:cellulose synthase/poly-beta-1,6-N-acetylglucosamine synthase-like glycosyltransferase